MLSALALSLWLASLFCDLLFLGGAEAAIWAPLALYTLVGGFAAALAAAVPQLRKFVAIAHVPVDLIVLALYAVILSLRLGETPSTALAIALSMVGVSFLAVSSWLGGRAKVRVEGLHSVLLLTGVDVCIGVVGRTAPRAATLF